MPKKMKRIAVDFGSMQHRVQCIDKAAKELRTYETESRMFLSIIESDIQFPYDDSSDEYRQRINRIITAYAKSCDAMEVFAELPELPKYIQYWGAK